VASPPAQRSVKPIDPPSDIGSMTTADRAIGAAPDWKVTPAYRVLIKIGWAAVSLAVYTAAVAVVIDIPAAWWVTAGLAAVALIVGVLIPAPVPRTLITGPKNHIDARQPLPRSRS
jgi:hypothetical protein